MEIWNGSEWVCPSRLLCESLTIRRRPGLPPLAKVPATVLALMLAGF
jgi:hypothetical protein